MDFLGELKKRKSKISFIKKTSSATLSYFNRLLSAFKGVHSIEMQSLSLRYMGSFLFLSFKYAAVHKEREKV